jgi:hypothetical protein
VIRSVGSRPDLPDLDRHDHLCWVYDDDQEMLTAALRFLEEGLRLGERVGYVGGVGVDRMAGELDHLARRRRPGATFTSDLGTTYQDRDPDPSEQVRIYRAATEEALRDGFTGLRVAADATMLVERPEARRTFLRYEHLVDRAMTTLPFSAMCAYDRRVLGPAVDELCCVHPLANDDRAGFGLYAAGPSTVGLRGEVDALGLELFGTALASVAWQDGVGRGGEVDVDARHLDFIDHRALQELDAALAAGGVRARLRCTSTSPARLVDLLELDHLDVEVVG